MDTTWSCPGLGDMRADSDRCLPASVPGLTEQLPDFRNLRLIHHPAC
jgi:hypothetical protein